MNFEEFKTNFENIPVIEHPNQVTDKPLVSVCVQTYNHVKYIKQCIDGILDQKTDFPIEILLGEDASTDGTREICIEYAKNNPHRIRLVLHNRENNLKIGGSETGRFNMLYNLFAANGHYIALCEGDDYWTDPLKLQKQIDFLRDNSTYSACFTNAMVIVDGVKGGQKKYIGFNGNVTYTVKDIIEKGGGLFPTASLVFRNSLIYPNFMTGFKSGDRILSLLLSTYGNFYFLNELTCVYRSHSGGIFSSIREDTIARNAIKMDNIELLKKFNSYSAYKYNIEIKSATSQLAKSVLLKNKNNSIFSTDVGPIRKELSIKDWVSLFYNRIIRGYE